MRRWSVKPAAFITNSTRMASACTQPSAALPVQRDDLRAELSEARAVIKQMVYELDRDEDDLVDVGEVADHVATIGRMYIVSHTAAQAEKEKP